MDNQITYFSYCKLSISTTLCSQSRSVEELGQDVGMTFEPAVPDVGRVKVTVGRCDLCQSVQLKEVTVFQSCAEKQ